jgi:hypothetical protein
MTSDTKRRFFRSPLFLFLILPLLISVVIHTGFIVYARFTAWQFGYADLTQPSKTILIDIKKKEIDAPLGAPHEGQSKQSKQPKETKPRSPAQSRAMTARALPSPGGDGGKKEAIGVLAGADGADWLKVDPSWGTGGGTGGMLHAGPQGTTQTFAEYIQGLRSRGLDIVIVFDSTGTMAKSIKEVKLKIENLALALRKLVPSCRIGLVTYRDRGDEYVTRTQPLTYGISSLQRFLNRTEADGGRDLREAVDEGLRVAVEQMNWNRKSKPFILLIGDAPPHKPDIPHCIDLVRKFRKEMGGTVSALDVRIPQEMTRELWKAQQEQERTVNNDSDPEISSYIYQTDRESVDDTFRMIAEAGGGEAARLINEEKLIRHMLLHIFGTKWLPYLSEIMKNL